MAKTKADMLAERELILADLARVARAREVYEEVVRALLRGDKPERIASGNWCLWVLGLNRAHGGLGVFAPLDREVCPADNWRYLTDVAGDPEVKADTFKAWAVREAAQEAAFRYEAAQRARNAA